MGLFMTMQRSAEGIKVMVGTVSVSVALVQWKRDGLAVQPLVIPSVTEHEHPNERSDTSFICYAKSDLTKIFVFIRDDGSQ